MPRPAEQRIFFKIVQLGPMPATYDILVEPFVLRGASPAQSSEKTSHNSIGLANLTAMQAFMEKQCLSRDTKDEI